MTREGFAVGVIQSKLRKGTEIGFAIPINEVKNLLDSRGLDHVMPTRRLRLGVFQAIDPKGVDFVTLPTSDVGLYWPFVRP